MTTSTANWPHTLDIESKTSRDQYNQKKTIRESNTILLARFQGKPLFYQRRPEKYVHKLAWRVDCERGMCTRPSTKVPGDHPAENKADRCRIIALIPVTKLCPLSPHKTCMRTLPQKPGTVGGGDKARWLASYAGSRGNLSCLKTLETINISDVTILHNI